MAENEPLVTPGVPGVDKIRMTIPRTESEPRWLFDYSDVYAQIKVSLMGGYLKSDGGNWVPVVPEGATPFLNKIGIEATMAFVTGFVTKIPATSIYTDERIMLLCEADCHMLIDFFTGNMERFELTTENASAVLYILMDAIEANYRKSIGGQALKLMLSTEQVRTVSTENQKKGIWSKLPFFG